MILLQLQPPHPGERLHNGAAVPAGGDLMLPALVHHPGLAIADFRSETRDHKTRLRHLATIDHLPCLIKRKPGRDSETNVVIDENFPPLFHHFLGLLLNLWQEIHHNPPLPFDQGPARAAATDHRTRGENFSNFFKIG